MPDTQDEKADLRNARQEVAEISLLANQSLVDFQNALFDQFQRSGSDAGLILFAQECLRVGFGILGERDGWVSSAEAAFRAADLCILRASRGGEL